MTQRLSHRTSHLPDDDLGLATQEHFLVLDNDIFMSQSQRQGLKEKFKDGRSIVSKRYQATASQSKYFTNRVYFYS